MIKWKKEQSNNRIIEKYCFKDSLANCTAYGGLYQWAEAVQYKNGANNTTSHPDFSGNIQGICPSGWHIPSEEDFNTLEKTEGSASDEALLAVGQGAGTNTSGFSALLVNYFSIGHETTFWSFTERTTCVALGLTLHLDGTDIQFSYNTKTQGNSVRCVKDY
jgi:uncharacterized protein (TIGR02145 family)